MEDLTGYGFDAVGLGFVVGTCWTLIWAGPLSGLEVRLQAWVGYGLEAVAVFGMALVLEKWEALTAVRLMTAMVAAGVGMFAGHWMRGRWRE